VGFLSILTIGIVVLPVAIGFTVLLARRPSSISGMTGIIAGLGLPLLYVAYLNRGGPGTVCAQIPGGESCSQEWSPWIWLGAGVFLVALGIATFIVTQHPNRHG